MTRFFLLLTFLPLIAIGQTNDEKLRQKAKALADRYIITDGHVDLPYRLRIKKFRLEREYMGIPVQSDEGDFDFERATKGGLDAPFMSIYIPSALQVNPDKENRWPIH
jgi:membrane dipeptidase